MSDSEREQWIIDDAYSAYGFLPERIAIAGNRMHLGAFRAPLRHGDPWDEFKTLVDAYQKAQRDSRVFRWNVPQRARHEDVTEQLHYGRGHARSLRSVKEMSVRRRAKDHAVLKMVRLHRGRRTCLKRPI